MKLISGMHRSGTSLVARMFHEAGADLGDPQSFHPPDRWNSDGYFEQSDILAINIPLINGPWWKLAYFRLPAEATIRSRGRTRAAAIRQTSLKYRDKVIKENRFCLTLSTWLDHGTEVDRIVVVLREPIEVASSLKKRDRVPLRTSYSLWLAHNRRLLATAEQHRIPFHFVLYRYLLDPDRQQAEAGSALRFMGFEKDCEEVRRLVAGIAKAAMNHNRSPTRSPAYPDPVRELWSELVHRHAAQQRLPAVETSGARE